jgi:5-methylcytosine-specific restriction endonuclease McrA
MEYTNYLEKLKDPRWQKKRLLIMKRDNFECRICHSKDKTLNVHHIIYFDYPKIENPWDYKDDYLITLCNECHNIEKDYKKNIIGELILTGIIKNTNKTLRQIFEEIYFTVNPRDKPINVEFSDSRIRKLYKKSLLKLINNK